ncbi:hypothetical protein A2164_04105 [Candidatus Curtissbacteria bacterium RBG_13_35_7]|uniref:Prolipoprotein diacylglyceryl transferase n=1 Tax=Candidatus Curtissbacteria bacterium RBG_13_35_7 TaxID=1797705 RepID=A0A1F5G2I8_9BACT|nr:MAG: hypothetical protein A2164_04105 [Candidatus Curtissbacteria bacterium RBG_13_35_7]
MITLSLDINNFVPIILFVILILAVFLALFLFFRAGRHELVDDEILFDTALMAIFGGLIGGRLIDFIFDWQSYGWSIKKLVFFNKYLGFDWYGALIGGAILSYLYLRNKKQIIFWFIMDFACAPVVFALIIVSLGIYFTSQNFLYLGCSLGYLVIFWVLKRLATTKRHDGFFVSVTLILISVLNLALFKFNRSDYYIFDRFNYYLILPTVGLCLGIFLQYFLAKKKIKTDIKSVIALVILGLFKLKRVMTSISEANVVSKSIIILPLSLVKLIANLVKLTGREIYISIGELLNVFGFKK